MGLESSALLGKCRKVSSRSDVGRSGEDSDGWLTMGRVRIAGKEGLLHFIYDLLSSFAAPISLFRVTRGTCSQFTFSAFNLHHPDSLLSLC
jgi:hypothetical protein